LCNISALRAPCTGQIFACKKDRHPAKSNTKYYAVHQQYLAMERKAKIIHKSAFAHECLHDKNLSHFLSGIDLRLAHVTYDLRHIPQLLAQQVFRLSLLSRPMCMCLALVAVEISLLNFLQSFVIGNLCRC
jgi:hypothetical protein